MATQNGGFSKDVVLVHGKRMAFHQSGNGMPVVFLHGNPTSSYLWRNVMPHLSGIVKCITPDLIGMGDSEKLSPSGPNSYRFVEHRHYLDEFLRLRIGESPLVLIVHDWGSALGFDWARRHADHVAGICYMESITAETRWEEWPDQARQFFQAIRSEAGEKMILEKNLFIERLLVDGIQRSLSNEEMTEYRRPFLNAGEDRRPMLTWPREIPISGTPADVSQIVQNYGKWMAANEIPKLFINTESGTLSTGRRRDICRAWKNQQEVTVKGGHYVQEDSPNEVGLALRDWLSGIALSAAP